ncbi:MAG: S-layer homology domain-containing protein, partial [Candidatus Gracilibacteria bacterium]|nr:S-layer homology domain-containing protein [Candidatus Gracilibacteria bacterium]
MKNPSKSLILSKALITLAFITVLTLLTFLPAANANPFLDVRQGSALETMVNEMVEKGIISGYPDGTFKPEQTINRAEALKIIFLASMITLNDQSLLTNLPFSDINTKEWYAPYIALAKLKNIVQGYPDGRFRPEQDVNRAEFIKMAMAAQRDYADDIAATDPIPFTDIDLQQWYAPYVIYGLQRNLIPKQSKLNPTGNMSRQNAVEIIYAVSHYNDERVKWENFDPNNPGEEYFNEITPYEPTSIPEDQIKITELPDGRKLIESFTSGYQLTVDKKTEVFTTAFEANTVKLSKGSCYTVISQDATNQ